MWGGVQGGEGDEKKGGGVQRIGNLSTGRRELRIRKGH